MADKLKSPQKLADATPFCAACKSYHAVPHSREHWAALQCFAPCPFPDTQNPPKGYRPPHGTVYTLRFDAPTDSYIGDMVMDGVPYRATGRSRRHVCELLDREYLKEQK